MPRTVTRRIFDTRAFHACPTWGHPRLRVSLQGQVKGLSYAGIFVAQLRATSRSGIEKWKHAETGTEPEEIFDRR
jgi:hypothetical protein